MHVDSLVQEHILCRKLLGYHYIVQCHVLWLQYGYWSHNTSRSNYMCVRWHIIISYCGRMRANQLDQNKIYSIHLGLLGYVNKLSRGFTSKHHDVSNMFLGWIFKELKFANFFFFSSGSIAQLAIKVVSLSNSYLSLSQKFWTWVNRTHACTLVVMTLYQ